MEMMRNALSLRFVIHVKFRKQWVIFLIASLCHSSMMLLDGPRRNITQKTNNLLVDRNMGVERSLLKKMVQLHSLASCGMKHLVTIMMLPPGSTMMELQVLFFPFLPRFSDKSQFLLALGPAIYQEVDVASWMRNYIVKRMVALSCVNFLMSFWLLTIS